MNKLTPSLRFRAQSIVAALGLCVSALSLHAQTYVWNQAVNNSWTILSNWTSTTSGYPNAAGAVADLSQVPISSGITVTFGSNVTIGTILLGDTDNLSPYTISAANGAILTFDNGASAAILKNTIGASNGSVKGNISLLSDLTVSNVNTGATTSGYMDIGNNGSGNTITAGSVGLKVINFSNDSTKRINVYSTIQDGVGQVGVIAGVYNPITYNDGTKDVTSLQTLNLFVANTFTGGLTVSGRIVTQAGLNDATLGGQGSAITFDGGSINFAGTFNASNDNIIDRNITLLAAGGSLEPNSGHTLTVTGVIDGAGALTKTAAGTIVLTATNSYAGGTIIGMGRLTVQNGLGDAALGAQGAALTFNGGILNFAGTFNAGNDNTVNRAVTLLAGGGTLEANSGHIITVSGIISGIGTLSKAAAGTVILTGNNTYTGGTVVNAGTLSIISDASLGAAGTAVTLNGGTLSTITNSFASSDRNLIVATNTTIRTDTFLNWNGSISGSGLLTKTGSSTFSLNNTNSNHIGGFLVSGGTIRFRGDGAMGAAGNSVTLSSGTTFASIDNQTLGAGRTITLLSGTANFNVTGSSTITTTWAGSITGAGGLNKNGTGVVVLTGQATYTGDTSVSVGTLRMGAENVIAATSGLILNGGTFDLNSHSQTMETLNLLASSTIMVGDSGLNTLVFGDSSAQSWNTTASLSITGNVVSGQTIRVGTSANGLTATQLNQILVNGNAVGIDTNGYLTFVPEPAALAQIMGLSALLVVGLRRRNRTR